MVFNDFTDQSGNFIDYYGILGIHESADEKTIKSVYRTKCLEMHPDRKKDHEKERFEAEFKKLNKAYNCLRNKNSRDVYNQYRNLYLKNRFQQNSSHPTDSKKTRERKERTETGGIRENPVTTSSFSNLFHAVERGNRKEVEELIAKSTGISQPDELHNRKTPLHAAASSGHEDILRILLERGANPNSRDRDKITPLHEAAGEAHPECVTLLLQFEAEDKARDKEGFRPIHYAAAKSNKRDDRKKVAELLFKTDADAEDQDNFPGQSPLHLAAENGLVEIIEILTRKGTRWNKLRNKAGRTPLDQARRYGHTDVINLLESYENMS